MNINQPPNITTNQPIQENTNIDEDLAAITDFIMLNTENDEEFNNNGWESNIDDIYNNISLIINSEKAKIQKEKENLQKTTKEFNDYKAQEVNKLEKDKQFLKEKLKLTNNIKENDIIDLNIGGTHEISTSRSTLTKFKNSALATLFSGYYNLALRNGKVFIDREGEPFVNMINYLRTGKFPVLKSKEEEEKFYDEIDFWKIPLYETKLQPSKFYFDPDWCSEVLTFDRNNTIVKKQNINHGIVLCKQQLDLYSPYIEFKVNMSIPWKGRSLLYIGLVDKTIYKYEHLMNKVWRESPNVYYWDVWNCQLIKTNESGTQMGCVKGYGCQCVDYETRLGIKYDYRTRCISFYKNGINLGVGFRNVPNGLTPAVDLCFENGSVQIVEDATCEQKKYL